jgi:hypothetical protein
MDLTALTLCMEHNVLPASARLRYTVERSQPGLTNKGVVP